MGKGERVLPLPPTTADMIPSDMRRARWINEPRNAGERRKRHASDFLPVVDAKRTVAWISTG
jgi:hypothetical protein